MRDEDNVLGLAKYNSLRYEKLTGDKQGLSSVSVNDQYRIEFEEEFENGKTVATAGIRQAGSISFRANVRCAYSSSVKMANSLMFFSPTTP